MLGGQKSVLSFPSGPQQQQQWGSAHLEMDEWDLAPAQEDQS